MARIFAPIKEVVEGRVYFSYNVKVPFEVKHRARHAQDCSISMIIFVNLEDTFDTKKGTMWTIQESLFLKTFLEGI